MVDESNRLVKDILWQPTADDIRKSHWHAFTHLVNRRSDGADIRPDELYQWSINNRSQFWDFLSDYCHVIADRHDDRVLQPTERIWDTRWFPGSRLNYAQNLIGKGADNDLALIFYGENQVHRRLTYYELRQAVSRFSQALLASGIKIGDRVVAVLPNMPEAIIAFLATSSIGAVWSSCSPDFGLRGVIDRFGQIEPTVLLGIDLYFYNGRKIDCVDKLSEIAAHLPSLHSRILVPYDPENYQEGPPSEFTTWSAFVKPFPAKKINYQPLPFDHPLYILYSSGTTGKPKCIVHRAGGVLLQHLKEHQLHCDIHPGDRIFYFTTCGWMMWNWLVSALASQACLLLYDGAPLYPDPLNLFAIAEKESIHVFGTSAKYIDALRKEALSPKDFYSLHSVKVMLSTGSPLVAEAFDYIYQEIKKDIRLCSISGGTDIVSCFMLGSPVIPIRRGEIQCKGLAMEVAVLDENGCTLGPGVKGELACLNAFPSMPLGFWQDPENERYIAAYFSKFPNIWCHGDFVAETEAGGIIVYGRSDATLNPGGVRIGTAEIYRQVEQLDEIVESIAVGQCLDGDVRIILFVVLRAGHKLDSDLIGKIKLQIKAHTTPRHVPSKVIQVTDIPRTKSGKIVELAVQKTIHNEPVKNLEALANPEALDHFINLIELRS